MNNLKIILFMNMHGIVKLTTIVSPHCAFIRWIHGIWLIMEKIVLISKNAALLHGLGYHNI